jgi:uncharacterized protein (TIGR02266 family)
MSGRIHKRVPFSATVEFRTPSSFLVAYSVNMSRGGMFLETEQMAEPGAPVSVQLTAPGLGPIALAGAVSWRRPAGHPDGPPGLGISFRDVGDALGRIIDELIARYEGIRVLVLSGRHDDREALKRMVRSILSTAEVLSAGEPDIARTLLAEDVDVAVIDVDTNTEEAVGLIEAARRKRPPIPTIALCGGDVSLIRARDGGADEIASNPPPFGELQTLLVRAIGRPSKVTC